MPNLPITRKIKNVVKHYSFAEVKVREATSNDPWGPTPSLMQEIADLTYNVIAFAEIMNMIWKRLNESGKQWRHCFKSLVLLDYLIKFGHEKVAQQSRNQIIVIRNLKDGNYYDDGKDQGQGIREKSKYLASLLTDEDRLQNERTKALAARNAFQHNSINSEIGSPYKPNVPHSVSDGTIAYSGQMDTKSISEDTELALALSLSKQLAEEEEQKRKADAMRLQLAIEESKKITPQKDNSNDLSLLMLETPSINPPTNIPVKSNFNEFDAWSTNTAIESHTFIDPWAPSKVDNEKVAFDPWAGTGEDLAAINFSSVQPASNTFTNLDPIVNLPMDIWSKSSNINSSNSNIFSSPSNNLQSNLTNVQPDFLDLEKTTNSFDNLDIFNPKSKLTIPADSNAMNLNSNGLGIDIDDFDLLATRTTAPIANTLNNVSQVSSDGWNILDTNTNLPVSQLSTSKSSENFFSEINSNLVNLDDLFSKKSIPVSQSKSSTNLNGNNGINWNLSTISPPEGNTARPKSAFSPVQPSINSWSSPPKSQSTNPFL